MRFGSGPDAIVARVRWFFTDATETVGPTVYGSHIWACDKKEWTAQTDQGLPGEVWGARRSRTPNVFYQSLGLESGNPAGSREAWLGAIGDGIPLFPCPGMRLVLDADLDAALVSVMTGSVSFVSLGFLDADLDADLVSIADGSVLNPFVGFLDADLDADLVSIADGSVPYPATGFLDSFLPCALVSETSGIVINPTTGFLDADLIAGLPSTMVSPGETGFVDLVIDGEGTETASDEGTADLVIDGEGTETASDEGTLDMDIDGEGTET